METTKSYTHFPPDFPQGQMRCVPRKSENYPFFGNLCNYKFKFENWQEM